ncbi:hypothetical protein ABGB12_11165 [Actinocorallia sp. B10E7]|uniref:hypothetical protein n=1 Tax=Actinocorallia sp. B10E7 TaxID=3153558 RepID=UPI00325D7952
MRFAVSLMFCGCSALVFVTSVIGMAVLPHTPGGRPQEDLVVGSLSPGDHAAVILLYPLLVVTGLLNAGLLGWGGVRGLQAVNDPALWRERQGAGLTGLAIAGAAGLISAIGSPPDGVVVPDSPVPAEATGYSMLVFFSLVGMAVLLCLMCEERASSRRADHAEGFEEDGGRGPETPPERWKGFPLKEAGHADGELMSVAGGASG